MVSVQGNLFKIDFVLQFSYSEKRVPTSYEVIKMRALSSIPEDRMREISFKLLQFGLQVPRGEIAGHQMDRRFSVLAPLVLGFASRFTALLQEHGLEVAQAIEVDPRELQHFCEALEESLGDRERRLFQARSIAGSGRPLI